MNYISVGSITVQSKWLILIAALFLSYSILKFIKKTPQIILEKIINSLFIGFIVFKFSLVLVEPSLVVNDPLSLLYFSGGELGYWLAILVAAVTFFWGIHRGKVQFQEGYKAIYHFSLDAFTIYYLVFLFIHFTWEYLSNTVFSIVLVLWSIKGRSFTFVTSSLIFAFYQILLANVFRSLSHLSIFYYAFYTILILVLLIVKKKQGLF
jgi:hypothetical protein